MLAAPLGELTVLYDLLTETVHVLNASAGLVWEACDGTTDLDAVAATIVDAAGVDPEVVTADLALGVQQLTDAGLVGRTTEPPAVLGLARQLGGDDPAGRVCAVLDERVRFRCPDSSLLADIDALLASLHDNRWATLDLTVRAVPDGTVRLTGSGAERTYGSRTAFLDALPTALNQIAAASTACIALHAGCVRSPAGEVVLLPATSGSGKTTLTAALVQAGWAYGTDEAVGVREGSLEVVTYPKPLVLDASSRAVLGMGEAASPNVLPRELRSDVEIMVGSAEPVGRVVLPRYEAGVTVSLSEPLEPREALIAVLEHALNLRLVGESGLVTLCQLAERVPVQRLVHGDVDEAVAALR